MKKNRQSELVTYDSLSKVLSDDEIVDSYVLRKNLSSEERKVSEDEFRRLRKAQLANESDRDRLLGDLMRMKIRINAYINLRVYDEEFSFSKQLRNYMKIIDRNQRTFASEIDVHYTKLSRLLNSKDNPSVELMYRLEKHSDNLIPATYWYCLHTKRLENEIAGNLKMRKSQYARVSNNLQLGETG